jgi:hypothetical protein
LLTDATYKAYSSSTMLDAAVEFINDSRDSMDDDQTLDEYALYLNANHKTWWLKEIRSTYGLQMDFTGPKSYANVMPDTDIPIKWVPNLGQTKLMFLQKPGNIQFLEYIPGEMFGVDILQDFEEIIAKSNWKEGCAPAYVGRQFSSIADMDTNNYALQEVFMNKPSVALAKDATTADAANGFWFETIAGDGVVSGEDTVSATITTISNAVEGPAYIIEIGSATYPQKIGKTGDFSEISAAWTPTTVGDYIMVYKNAVGKFIDLERRVAGVRTINTAVQPNVPGAR